MHIYHARHVISLLGVNILGDSYINYITCLEMHFYYNETITKTKRHNISVNHYHSTTHRFRGNYGIYLHMSQYTYKIAFHVLNTFIGRLKQSTFLCTISNNSAIQNTVLVTNCQFTNNSYLTFNYLFYSVNVSVYFNSCQFFYNKHLKCNGIMSIIHSENIGILNSNFSHNILPLSKKLINITNVLNAIIKHCYFDGNIVKVLLYAFHSALLIHNTTFSKTQIPLHIINGYIIGLVNTKLLLSGPVKFHKNGIHYRSIIALINSGITVHGYIEFSKNYACSLTSPSEDTR